MLANNNHSQFSGVLGRETLRDISLAALIGAKLVAGNRRHIAGNGILAESQILIVFSWNEGLQKNRTEADWEKCSGKKVHVVLESLIG